jgi:hypothetical protein
MESPIPPPTAPSRISSFIARLRTIPILVRAKGSDFNAWVAARLKTTRARVLQIEIGFLVAVGFTLMQIGEWAGAVGCWVLLGVILSGKALAWGGIRAQTRVTLFLRLFSVMGAITVAGLLITITDLRKPDTDPWSNLQKLRQQKAIATSPTPRPELPLTLESLFKSDFPNLMKLTITADPTVFENGEAVTVTSQEYVDFAARSSFIGYYIPATDLTFRVCVRLANSSRSLIDGLAKRMDIKTFDASGTTLKDLTFSGRVFIYHTMPLTLKQKFPPSLSIDGIAQAKNGAIGVKLFLVGFPVGALPTYTLSNPQAHNHDYFL